MAPPPPPDADLLLWSAAQVHPPPEDRRNFIWVGAAVFMAAMMVSVGGLVRYLNKRAEVRVPNTKEKKKQKETPLVPFSLCFDNMGWKGKLVIGLFVFPVAVFVVVVVYEYLKSRI